MDVEEEAVVEVNSRFGYGILGRTATPSFPEIPPHANLTYNITLKNIQMEPIIEELSCRERRKIGYTNDSV